MIRAAKKITNKTATNPLYSVSDAGTLMDANSSLTIAVGDSSHESCRRFEPCGTRQSGRADSRRARGCLAPGRQELRRHLGWFEWAGARSLPERVVRRNRGVGEWRARDR